jgi:hypothetical protein
MKFAQGTFLSPLLDLFLGIFLWRKLAINSGLESLFFFFRREWFVIEFWKKEGLCGEINNMAITS